MKSNSKYLKSLIKLMDENPELPVMCKVDSDIVAEDGYAWWLGELDERHEPQIQEYSTEIEECVQFKDDEDYETWFDEIFDTDEFIDVPDDGWGDFMKKKVDEAANWEKAIFIRITTR